MCVDACVHVHYVSLVASGDIVFLLAGLRRQEVLGAVYFLCPRWLEARGHSLFFLPV